jgi:Fur family transcriptional regulator, peroxide stress response regulator
MNETKPRRFRMTRQREIILDALMRSESHPTADELYQVVREQIPRISLGTIYRNLEVLCDQGMATKLEMGAQRRYDGTTHEHYHARCLICDSLFDIPAGGVPSLAVQLPPEMGFEITNVKFEVRGLCRPCRGGNAGPRTRQKPS